MEGKFAFQAKLATLITGLTGFYMLEYMGAYIESGIGDNAKALEFTQSVSKGVTDATLTGAMIKETFLAKDGTYFVLMEYSLDDVRRHAIESARQEEAAWNEFRADQGFDAVRHYIRLY